MKKHWFMSIIAAMFVVVCGTAFASFPSGSNTTFRIEDPAVTVTASGQTTDGAEATACAWTKEATTYCFDPELTFTPAQNAICSVNMDIALYGDPMGKEAGRLNSVAYGIGERVEEEDSNSVDPNEITSTPTYLSEQTISRSRLVPVKAGTTYTFEPFIHSYETSVGTGYWDLIYVCYGA